MTKIPLDSETFIADGSTIFLNRERRISSLASARGRIGMTNAAKKLKETLNAEIPTVDQQERLDRKTARQKTKRDTNSDWEMN